jgi:hypothetical protein
MTKLQAALKRSADKENTLGITLKLLYKILSSASFQAVVSFIFTFLIGKFTFTTGHELNLPFLLPVGGSYIVISILFIIANKYKNQVSVLNKVTTGCLKEITTITYTVKESITAARAAYHENKNEPLKLNQFYTCAVSVCESIFYLLSEIYGHKKFKVTIFQQCKRKEGSRYAKMIAYKSHENKRPKCYNKELPLFKNSENKLFIVKLFEQNSTDIVCFDKKEQVDEQFLRIDNGKINTKQYMAIPCQADCDSIAFIIQIASYDVNMFESAEQMKELGDEILVSYRELLALINEQKLLLDNIIANERKVVPYSAAGEDAGAEDASKGKTFEPV